MRGVYTATIRISALSAAKTLMYITAPSTAVVELLSASVTNESNGTNQQLLCELQKVTTLGTPTATTITAHKHEGGDQTAASTVKGNVTASEPSYTDNSGDETFREGFSSVGGWFYDPMPEERKIVAPSASYGLRMISTPTAFDAVIRLTFREIG